MISGYFDTTEASVRLKTPGDTVTVTAPHVQVDIRISPDGKRVYVETNTSRNGKTIFVEDKIIYS